MINQNVIDTIGEFLKALSEVNTKPEETLKFLEGKEAFKPYLNNMAVILKGPERGKGIDYMSTLIREQFIQPVFEDIKTSLENPAEKVRDFIKEELALNSLKVVTDRYVELEPLLSKSNESLVVGILRQKDLLFPLMNGAKDYGLNWSNTNDKLNYEFSIQAIESLGTILDSYAEAMEKNLVDDLPIEMVTFNKDLDLGEDSEEVSRKDTVTSTIPMLYTKGMEVEILIAENLSLVKGVLPRFRTGKVSIGKSLKIIENTVDELTKGEIPQDVFLAKCEDRINVIKGLVAISNHYVAEASVLLTHLKNYNEYNSVIVRVINALYSKLV